MTFTDQESEAIKELEITKQKFEEANAVTVDNQNRLAKQNKIIQDIEVRDITESKPIRFFNFN